MARTVVRVKPEALRDARLAFIHPDGRKGVSLQDLAELTGISYPHLWRLESGDRANVREPTMLAIANALRVDARSLFEWVTP